MDKTLPFISPLIERTASTFHFDILQQAVDLFQEGKHKEAFVKTLDIIRPETCKNYGNDSQDLFTIPHGSVQLEVTLTDTEYTIRAPFLQLGEKGTVAQLRQMLQFNSATLTLPQVVLEEDKLFFTYSAPLSLSHPHKIWMIFQQICWVADQQDDLFVHKFNATVLSDTPKKEFTQEQQQKAWELFQQCLKEAKEYASYMETKRFLDLAIFAFHTAFMRIDILFSPQGYLRSELFKAVSQACDYSISPAELLPKVKTIAQELENVDENTFKESLYTPKFFVSFEPVQDIATIQNMLQKDYEVLKADIAKNEYAAATVFAFKLFYDLWYRFTLPKEVRDIVVNGLQESAEKQWRDSAQVLSDAMGKIMHLGGNQPSH